MQLLRPALRGRVIIGVALSPWIASGIGLTTFVVYLGLHFRNVQETHATGLAMLAGAVVLLVLQSLGVV